MACEAPADTSLDWARGGRSSLIWWIPAILLLVSPLLMTRYLTVVWPALLALMGVACLLNARRCGRIHCYVTGPFFLILALVALLHGLDIFALGVKGWWVLSTVFVIGSAALIQLPEVLLGRYRSAAQEACRR
jgi:hypothetical protein